MAKRHPVKEPPEEEEEEEQPPEEEGGRSRRRAARRASKKMADAISVLKGAKEEEEEDERLRGDDDDRDEAFKPSREQEEEAENEDDEEEGDDEEDEDGAFEEDEDDEDFTDRRIKSSSTPSRRSKRGGKGSRGGRGRGGAKAKKVYPRTFKPCLLDPAGEMEERERAFRERCFGKNAFEEWNTKREDWRALSEEEAKKHLPAPRDSKSVQFSVASTAESGEERSKGSRGSLGLFEASFSRKVKGEEESKHATATTFFAGATVWGAAWCPSSSSGEGDSRDRYLAVSTNHPEADKEDASSGLIQIWRFSSGGEDDDRAEMALGIAHKGRGRVWSLKWCPSLAPSKKDSGTLPRLGLLACAGSDGQVWIYSVCRPESLQQKQPSPRKPKPKKTSASVANLLPIYSCDPVRTLRISPDGESSPPECLSLSWHRGLSHRSVAAGFSDGSFSLWDLSQPEGSLSRDGRALFPRLHSRRAHSAPVLSLDLSDDSAPGRPHLPALLATGSSDRYVSVWDLSSPSTQPAHTAKRGLVTCVSFLRHLSLSPHLLVSSDDVYLQSHTQTVALDVFSSSGGKKATAHPLAATNSAVWCQSLCPRLGASVLGTAAGEALLHVWGHPDRRSIENDKESLRRRVHLFRTEEEEDKALTFVDSPFSDLPGSMPTEEQKRSRGGERMDMEKLGEVGRGVTRVDVHPDLEEEEQGKSMLVFAGGQVGLGRVFRVRL